MTLLLEPPTVRAGGKPPSEMYEPEQDNAPGAESENEEEKEE